MKSSMGNPKSDARKIIIAGVNKGGTTSLFSLLTQSPAICGSSVKETCYFLPERYGEHREDEEAYWQFFSSWQGEPWLLESTPGYFYGGRRLINAIRQVVGADLKIVLILREPVSRAVSFFRFKQAMLELPGNLTFQDYVDRCLKMRADDFNERANNPYFGVAGGCYANYIEPWLAEFSGDLYITFHDELNRDAGAVSQRLLRWLGVNASESAPAPGEGGRDNVTAAIKYRSIQRAAIAINRKAEPFLRKNRRLKNWLRVNYYRLNSAADSSFALDEGVRKRLEQFYIPLNQQLRQQLEAFPHAGDASPVWLTE